jgi:hypothetical protein
VQAATYSHVEVLIAVALTYWMVNSTLGRTARWLEQALQPYRRRQRQPTRRGPTRLEVRAT